MSRRLLFAVIASLAAAPTVAADVGVSVSIGQPGFFGRIDVGAFPPPPVIYPQPVVVIAPAPVAVMQRPIYLRVPPGHERNWGKHCRRYNACGQRTYFVQEDWYHTVYAPAYIGPRHHAHRHGGYKHSNRKDKRHHRHSAGRDRD